MSFDDVCWHEAGHAVIAGLHGLSARQSAVRMDDDGSWVGFNRLTGHPGSMFIVAAAGVAGELIRLHAKFDDVDQATLERALGRARDDEVRHGDRSRHAGSALTFIETIKSNCWPALQANHDILSAMADELALNRSIGPLVHAAIMSGLAIDDSWRKADHLYLEQLPAPPATPA